MMRSRARGMCANSTLVSRHRRQILRRLEPRYCDTSVLLALECGVGPFAERRRAAADAKAHRPIWRLPSWLYRRIRQKFFNGKNRFPQNNRSNLRECASRNGHTCPDSDGLKSRLNPMTERGDPAYRGWADAASSTLTCPSELAATSIRGSSTLTTVPRPTWLSSQMSPP
jgi:hypothetical protein